MGFYLIDHPPTRPQYLTRRRASETGCVVVHTPEGGLDLHPPDTKAEQVAAYIASRSTPGSYHWISDSDSSVPMIPWTYEAAQDGTGSNPWAVGLSIACNADQWPHLLAYEPAWVDGALEQLAFGAAAYAADLYARTGIVIPARRISKAQSDAGHPGFISHAERDPGRRSDPGLVFPWSRFLNLFTSMTTLGDDDMYGDWDRARDQFTADRVERLEKFFAPFNPDWNLGAEAVLNTQHLVIQIAAQQVTDSDLDGLAASIASQLVVEVDGLTEDEAVTAVKRALREGTGV